MSTSRAISTLPSRYALSHPIDVAEGWELERVTAPSRLFGANGLRTGPDGRIYIAQVTGSQGTPTGTVAFFNGNPSAGGIVLATAPVGAVNGSTGLATATVGSLGNTGATTAIYAKANREALRAFLAPETTRWQYTHGVTDASTVSPDGQNLDNYYLARPGADEVQLDLFGDYKSNVAMYPKFQAYFREHKPPLLAVWGKNDPFFLPPGAEAFRRDMPRAEPAEVLSAMEALNAT